MPGAAGTRALIGEYEQLLAKLLEGLNDGN
jgi:hypothetical protein